MWQKREQRQTCGKKGNKDKHVAKKGTKTNMWQKREQRQTCGKKGTKTNMCQKREQRHYMAKKGTKTNMWQKQIFKKQRQPCDQKIKQSKNNKKTAAELREESIKKKTFVCRPKFPAVKTTPVICSKDEQSRQNYINGNNKHCCSPIY
jgi:hypothetical protein